MARSNDDLTTTAAKEKKIKKLAKKSQTDGKKIEKEKRFLKSTEPKYDIFVEPKDEKREKYKGSALEDEEFQSLIQGNLFAPPDEEASEVELDDFFNYEGAFEDAPSIKHAESQSVPAVDNDGIALRLSKLEEEELNVLSDLKSSLQQDIKKGETAKRQLLYWNELVDQLLTPVHKALKLANIFPSGKIFAVLASQRVPLFNEISASCALAINSALKTVPGEDMQIDAAYDVWSQLDHLNKQIESNCLDVFDSWNSKVNITSVTSAKNQFSQQKSKMKVISQGISFQFNASLRDMERLVQRTNVNREQLSIFGDDAQRDAPLNVLRDIFDDFDFYSSILKDKLDATGLNQAADPSSIVSRINALKSSKIKKIVDTKASKGRKIRYEVYEKLVNFMAPVQRNLEKRWPDEKCDEFYASLFGKKADILEVRASKK